MARLILAVALMLIHATNTDWECSEDEWHFILKGYEASEIEVEFSDGQVESVPLWKTTGAVSHYRTDPRDINDVRAYVPKSWDGVFVISHGPCNETDIVLSSFEAGQADKFIKSVLCFVVMVAIVAVEIWRRRR